MDPWRDCQRIYDPHFSERMKQRHLPDFQVTLAINDGNRIEDAKEEYTIKWKKWTIKATRGKCFILLVTAYPS